MARDDFDEAKAAKTAIDNLRHISVQLTKLDQEKKLAVQRYGTARHSTALRHGTALLRCSTAAARHRIDRCSTALTAATNP